MDIDTGVVAATVWTRVGRAGRNPDTSELTSKQLTSMILETDIMVEAGVVSPPADLVAVDASHTDVYTSYERQCDASCSVSFQMDREICNFHDNE
jgi:hypothetical protein